MRYNVGDKVAFLKINYTSPPDTFAWGRMYWPWRDTLTSIDVKVMTVIEHHKVAWDQDPKMEKKYDGFVMTDGDGETWNNQFPAASYGQIDTSADRRVHRYVGKTDEDTDSKYRIAFMEDALAFMDNILLGIKMLNESADDLKQNKVESLMQFFQTVQDHVETAMNLRIGVRPWEITNTDGTVTVLEDIKEVFYI